MTDPAAPVAEPALVSFLQGRDEPCPSCGYNLRGVESAKCPECGGELRLTLASRRRLRGWGPFLLLVFGWLLLAGGMNSARQLGTLRSMQAQQAQAGQSMIRARAALQAQIKSLQQRPTRDPFAGMLDERFPGMESMRQFQAQAMKDMDSMMAQQLQAQLARLPAPAPAATPTLVETWKQASWQVQVGSVWSVSLAGLSLLGLAVLGIVAWRGRGPIGMLVVSGWALFACYGAWHILLFVNEMR